MCIETVSVYYVLTLYQVSKMTHMTHSVFNCIVLVIPSVGSCDGQCVFMLKGLKQ